MSESESDTIDVLISRIANRLGHDERCTLTEHLRATRVIIKVRDRLLHGEQPNGRSCLMLLHTGIAVHRRCMSGIPKDEDATGDACVSAANEEQEVELFRNTRVLLFVLLCMLQKSLHPPRPEAFWSAKSELELYESKCLSELLLYSDDTKMSDVRECDGTCTPCQPTNNECSRLGLVVGCQLLLEDAPDTFPALSALFFRFSLDDLLAKSIIGEGNEYIDFVGLGVSKSSEDIQMAIRTIVQNGESELGQQVLRDMHLSFMLPFNVIGVRTLHPHRERALCTVMNTFAHLGALFLYSCARVAAC